jgi:hypothetical protein
MVRADALRQEEPRRSASTAAALMSARFVAVIRVSVPRVASSRR